MKEGNDRGDFTSGWYVNKICPMTGWLHCYIFGLYDDGVAIDRSHVLGTKTCGVMVSLARLTALGTTCY